MLLAMQSFATPANATGVYDIPSVTAGEKTWIVDQAEVLSRITEGQINSTLENLAKQTGNEVRFVTIHRLDYGETTQSFTDQLFDKWFPTPETQANQTVLAIDTVTNTTGIHIGEKVKSLMSDEIAQSVASETVLVPLRAGDKYNQAFVDASDRISAVLSGKPDPGAPVVADNIQVESTFKKAEETDTGGSTIWVIGLLIAATVIPMATYYWYQSMGS
jgi:uncharacterized protein